jgi:hypothetical protein
MATEDLAAIDRASLSTSASSASAATTRFTRPCCKRRPGIDEIAGEQHLERLLAPEVARQADPRRRAEQADVDAGGGKARAVDRNRQVAHRHQLTTGCRGNAMHARDHRLRHLRQGHHHPAAAPEQILHEGLVVVGAHLLEIVSGTKGLAGTGDDHDAHRRVRAMASSCACKAAIIACDRALNCCGAIQRQRGDAIR